MAHIDYFTFTLSPFAYLAGLELEEVAAKHGATITYKPFALLKVFERTGGTPPGERHISRQSYRAQDLPRVARRKGMPFNLQPAHWPTNPVPSCAAIIAAQEAGGGDLGALTHGFLRACWGEERDVADDAVVRDVLAAAGFDPDLADQGLLSGAEAFERNTEEAVTRHVFGAPFYLVGEEAFWGQDRIPYLDDHLASLS
ncbi:MAG: 2-hydroxychromene-2-carboxylate isomerase [Pseudomonadota bacterium]